MPTFRDHPAESPSTNYLVQSGDEAAAVLAEQFHLASTGRARPRPRSDIPKRPAGPDHVSWPADPGSPCYHPDRAIPHTNQIPRSRRLIQTRSGLLLYVGGGVLKAGAAPTS